MSEQINLFKPKAFEKGSVDTREERTIKRTVKQLSRYEHAIHEAILNCEAKIKREKNEKVADVYRISIKNYEEELKYLNDVIWERIEEV